MAVAAGSGTRLAAGAPKAFVEAAGATLLQHAVRRVVASGSVDVVVAVVPPDLVDAAATALPEGVVVTVGGSTRQGSVLAGLRALARAEAPQPAERRCDVVLVHDAARCLAPPALVAAVAAAVRAGHPVVVPVLPVHDAVRSVSGPVSGPAEDGGSAVVDRAALRAVQTPQGFARAVLEEAHAAAAEAPEQGATDDAALAERLGHRVHLVPGHEEAFKVTRPIDLALARALLAGDPR